MASLTLANLLAYVVQVSVIAGATAAGMALLRLRNPETRYWSWRALLWLAVVLPLVQPWNAATVIVAPAAGQATAAVTGLTSTMTAISPGDAAADGFTPVLLIILAGVAVRLLWLAVGAIRLRRIAGSAESDLSDAAPLQEAITTTADVRYSGDLAQPATCGFRRPVVLLPIHLRTLPESVRRAVLAHELVHVRRGDWSALMVEELLRAALWFNPAVWWLIDRVHAAREEVVDAEAVLYVDGRRTYISALLAFADAPAVAAAPAFARRRHLFSRIKRLCEESTMSSRRFLVTTCLLGLTITASTLYAVNAFPLRSGDDLLVAPEAPAGLVESIAMQDPLPPPPPPVPATPPPPPVEEAVTVYPPPPLPQDPPPPPPAVAVRQTPKVIRDVKPSYPPDAMRAGIEGSVEIEVTIGDDGKVTSSRVVQSSNPVFDQAALTAANQWLFSRPTEGPVARTIELTFSLRSNRRNAEGTTPGVEERQASPDAVRIGGNIRAPMKIKHVSPVYPDVAKNARVSGMVILEVVVDRDGRVTDAQVLRSIPLLDQAAIDAVMQWTFNPTLLNGNPVPVIMTVTVNFTPEL